MCATEDTINRVKRQPTGWKEICANHISDKRLISRIYGELIKLNNKKTQLDSKMDKGLEKTFLQRRLQKANKHMKDAQHH